MQTKVINLSLKKGDTLKLALTLFNMPTQAENVQMNIKNLCGTETILNLNLENGGVVSTENPDLFIIFLDKINSDSLDIGDYKYSIKVDYGAEVNTFIEGQLTVGD